MRLLFNRAIACAAIVAVAACGGKQTMASRSAAAYRQAIAGGQDVGAEGHVHGGHTHDESAEAATATHDMNGMAHDSMQGVEHQSMPAMKHGSPADMKNMPGMQHGSTSAMDHSQMQHGSSQSMANMPGMQHGSTRTMDHSQMEHGASQSMPNMPGMSHGAMEAMQHGGTIPPGGLWGPQPGSLAPNAAATQTPGALQPDALDAAAPVSVEEARKSAWDDMSGMPGMDHGSASTPAAPGASDSKQVTYTCPMHPEVVATAPGTCPKCGMMLVKRGLR
jgi:hypothetical protein